MYCSDCGTEVSEDAKFCQTCGMALVRGVKETPQKQENSRVGYSSVINDPAFARYIKNSNRWSAIFSIILALIAVSGFSIYGEVSPEMENPEALFIGLGIGAMFIVIALFQIRGRNKSKTWDGVVVDKKIQQKRRKRNAGKDDYYWEDYTLFSVLIRNEENNKIYSISAENDDTRYNYYKIGDRVRHHGGLNSYEKYDKSGDNIVFCNACSSINDIEDDFCFRCRCPLLK